MIHFSIVQKIFVGSILLAGLCLLSACAQKPLKDQEDPFVEKWQELARNSAGYSAPRVKRTLNKQTIFTHSEPDFRTSDKALPSMPITLKLHDVDINIVLRTLAAVSGTNIILTPSVTGTVRVDVNGVPWGDVFQSLLVGNSLNYKWQGDVLQVMTLTDVNALMQREVLLTSWEEQQRAGRRAGPLVTSVVEIRYGESADFQENLKQFLSKDSNGKAVGSIVVDKHSNALIIQATNDDQERILRLLDNLDRPRAQVLIKAHIVETTKDTAMELGVRWGGKGARSFGVNQLGLTGPVHATTWSDKPNAANTGVSDLGDLGGLAGLPSMINLMQHMSSEFGGGLSFAFLNDDFSLEAQLRAMQTDGRVNILSSPSITTLDNQMAYTENGEKVPYVSRDGDGDNTVKFEDAVLRLEITPHIIDEANLKMKIFIQKDEVDMSRQVEGNPYIIKKETATTLIAQHGETIVISGLTKERATLANSKVPGLGDIPALGELFKAKGEAEFFEEVLIFITPHVLPYRDLYDEDGVPFAGTAR